MRAVSEDDFLLNTGDCSHVERVGAIFSKDQIDLDQVGLAIFDADNVVKEIKSYEDLPKKRGRLVYYVEK